MGKNFLQKTKKFKNVRILKILKKIKGNFIITQKIYF